MTSTLLLNSLQVSALATVFSVALGFMAALWGAGLEPRWRSRVIAFAAMALALPPFLVTNCWLHYLGTNGVWRGWLHLSIISLGGAVWILGLMMWPITFITVLGAWNRLQAAQLESDSAVTGLWLVRGLLLPVARSSLANAAVLTFVLTLNNFAVPAILQVKIFPAEVWIRFNTTFDALGSLKLSWPMVAGPLLLLLWFFRRDLSWPRFEGAVPARLFRRQLGTGWFYFCGGCALLACFLSVLLPVFQLASVTRTWTELPGALAAGQAALLSSLLLACGSATVIVCMALTVLGLSPTLANSARFGRAAILLWLPFLIPGVLLGIGLVVLLNHPLLSAFYHSAGIVLVAFVVRYLAPGWTAVAHGLQGTDRDLGDAARLEGASRWQMLRHVYWPQMAPQAAAGWYVVFLLCLWDVESIILVVPPGGETLALRIFNLLHYGHNPQVNALCLTLLALAMLPLALWSAGKGLRKFGRAGR